VQLASNPSFFENRLNDRVDGSAQVVGLAAESAEFVIEGCQLLNEVFAVVIDAGRPCISAWVEAPTLGFNLRARYDLAQTGYVDVGAFRKPLPKQRAAALGSLDLLASVKTRDVGQESDLLR
jgi:carbohydrate-selective porin OprB